MLKNKLSTIQQEIAVFPKNIQQIYNEMKNLGPKGLLKVFWTDLFANRTFSQWLYLISLSFIIPISIEYWVNGTIVDPISLWYYLCYLGCRR
jgi:nicotinamide mononucleotide transporter